MGDLMSAGTRRSARAVRPGPARAARQAIGWIDAAAHWMRTDMAAIMRQVPEQSLARSWWAETHPARPDADITEILAHWIPFFYGVPVTPRRPRSGEPADSGGLSVAADLISQLLHNRADVLDAAPVYVLTPDVATVLVTLAHTATYHHYMPDQSSPPAPTGHIALSDPVTRTRPASGEPTNTLEPFTSSANEPAAQRFCGITWHTGVANGDPVVRVNDWIVNETPEASGIDSVDETVRRLMNGPDRDRRMAPMRFTDAWSQNLPSPEPESADHVDSARARATAAFREVHRGDSATWDGAPIDDSHLLLSPLLLRVVWDAIAAGLVTPSPVVVPNPGSAQEPSRPRTRTVTVLAAPAAASEASR